MTVQDESPTPILATGVERRCAIDTWPDAGAGRPQGLYGNRFAAAPGSVIRSAVRVLDPPTETNLVAIAAPRPNHGHYTGVQIEQVLQTAYTGYCAARLESERGRSGTVQVVLHTGFWGCGAFGGNREIMAVLQLMAAGLANLDLVVFHIGDASGAETLQQATRQLDALRACDALGDWIAGLESKGYEWGTSDGN